MGTAIESTVIGGDLRNYQDQIWEAEALPNNTTLSSSEFVLGNTMAGVEVKVVVQTAVTLTAAITINLQTTATTGTGYATVLTKSIALGAVTLGQVLAKFILPKEEVGKIFARLQIVSTANEAAGKVDAYIVQITE